MHAPRILEIAHRQYGLVTVSQLGAAGVDDNATTRWIRNGRLHRVHRGVYALGHRVLSHEAHLLAAVLAVGPGAAVSHRSAGRLWGFIRERGDIRRDRVEVIVPRRLNNRKEIRIHFCASLHPRDVMHWDRIPVTTPARTLLDLAASLPDDALRRAVRQAEVDRLVVQFDLEEQLARAPGLSRAARRLAAVVASGPAPTRSELEDRLLALLERHGFPRPQVNARLVVAGRRVEVDFLFAELRLVVETDGDRFHGTKLAREADAARQAELEAAGYRVVRLNWRQVDKQEDQTVKRLRRVVDDQTR